MTLTMTNQTTVTELLGMSDSDFKEVVEQDIRGAAPTYADALRTPEVVPRWHNHLMRIKASVEGQQRSRQLRFERDRLQADIVGNRGAERDFMKVEAEYTEWRRRITTFHTGVLEKLVEARGFLVEYRSDLADMISTLEAYDKVLERQNQIFAVIQRHRDNFPSDDEPSQDDEDLWALLDPTPAPDES